MPLLQRLLGPSKSASRVSRGCDLEHAGSSKNGSLRFIAARVVQLLAVRNPSLMGLTDRHQCDDRLFGQVQRTADTPGRTPVLAIGGGKMHALLNHVTGGGLFTTLHKLAAVTPLWSNGEARGGMRRWSPSNFRRERSRQER